MTAHRDADVDDGRLSTAPGAEAPPLPPRYQSPIELGRGGMGVVYRAWDATLQRAVAIKVIQGPRALSRPARKRFLREVRALAQVQHPNVVRIFDSSSDAGLFYFTMELVQGRSLRSVIAEEPLAPARAVAMAAQLADGLAAVHAAGLVHRDLKPENVLLSEDGTVKLMDFGLAAALDPEVFTRLTLSGQIVGTARYMAPEMLRRGEADARSDVYQVGLLLYEALTGYNPISTELLARIAAGAREVALDPPSRWAVAVEPNLDGLVMEAMAYEPARRVATAAALAERLHAWRDPLRPSLASQASAPGAPRRPNGRRVVAPALLALLLVALVAAALGGRTLDRPGRGAGAARAFAVLGAGARSVLVAWRGAAGEPHGSLEVRRDDDDGGSPLPLTVSAVDDAPLSRAADESVLHRCLLRGLEPGSSYRIALRPIDGGPAPERTFRTAPTEAFSPVARLALTTGDQLLVSLDSTVPFAFTRAPQPRGPGLDFAGSHEVRLPFATRTDLLLTSLDGTAALTSVEGPAWLGALSVRVHEEFRADYRAGTFLRRFSGRGSRLNTVFADAARRFLALRRAGRSPSVDERAAFWRDVTGLLERDAAWYRSLRPALPGLPALLRSVRLEDPLRATLARALLPLELLRGAAVFFGLPTDPSWDALASPDARPYPVVTVEGAADDEPGWREFVPVDGYAPRKRCLLDPYHPRASAIWSPTVIESLAEASFTTSVVGVAAAGDAVAELELTLATGMVSALPVVDLNEGRFTAAFPLGEAHYLAFCEYLQETQANQAPMLLALRQSLPEAPAVQAFARWIDAVGLPRPLRLRQRVPLSALVEGRNVARVTVLSAPVEEQQPTGLHSLRLRIVPRQ